MMTGFGSKHRVRWFFWMLAVLLCTGCGGGGGGGIIVVLGPHLQPPATNASAGLSPQDSAAGVWLHSGEFRLSRVDMAIRARRLGIVVKRFYGSLVHEAGPFGFGWDSNIFMRLDEQSGGDVIWHPGNGTAREFADTGGGTYDSPPGVFARLIKDATGFTLRYPQGLKCRFDLNGVLQNTTDPAGNQVRYQYTGIRLTSIFDEYNREVVLTYTGNLVETITDFTGNQVMYTYDAADNLVAVRSPTVNGTPNGNDFPAGRTERYTYVSGSASPELNHNLLTIVRPNEVADASNTPSVVNTYGGPGVAFDRVVTQVRGGANASGRPAGGMFSFTYDFAPVGGPVGTASLTTVRDRRNNVAQYFHDAVGHCLRYVSDPGGTPGVTDFMVNPDGLVTRRTLPLGNRVDFVYDTVNPDRSAQRNVLSITLTPDGVRPSAHPQLMTTYTYDPVYNMVRTITDPRGNDPAYVPQNGGAQSAARYTTHYFYDYQEGNTPPACVPEFGLVIPPSELNLGDLNGDGRTDQRAGNLVRREDPTVALAAGSKQAVNEGDTQQEHVTRYAYDDFSRIVELIDARGNRDVYAYFPENDPDGDGANLIAGNDPAAGGYRSSMRVDVAGPGRQDAATPVDAQTSYRYDDLGNLVALTDPNGNEYLYLHNELGELVEREAPKVDPGQARGFLTHYTYDANGNVVRTDAEHWTTDPSTHQVVPGSPSVYQHLMTFDILDRVIRVDIDATRDAAIPASAQAQRLMTDYHYDANENIVDVRSPMSTTGAQPEARVLQAYDAHDRVFIRQRGGLGADSSAINYFYDANDNLTGIRTQNAGNTHFYAYDGFDRMIQENDRGGNVCTYAYDAVDRLIRYDCTGPADGSGGGNVALSGADLSYDELGRLIGVDRDLFVPAGIILTSGATVQDGALTPGDSKKSTRYEYDALSRQTVITTDDLAQDCFVYDGLDRLVRQIRPLVDPAGPTPQATDYFYDAVDLIRVEETHVSPDSLVAPATQTSHVVFDALHRLTRVTDAKGQTTYFDFDSANRVVSRWDARGASIADPLGLFTAGNINDRGNGNHYAYDGAGRLWLRTHELRVNGQGDQPLDMTNPDNADGLIRIVRQLDANGRLVSLLDDVGNQTTYEYDALDRRTVMLNPDGSQQTYAYDFNDNMVQRTDENGTVMTGQYDALDRLTRLTGVTDPLLTVAGGAHPLYVGSTELTWQYDGLSRVTRATDNNEPGTAADDSVLVFKWDSCGRKVEEVQDGLAVGVSYDADDPVELRYPGASRVVSYEYDPINQPTVVSNPTTIRNDRYYQGRNSFPFMETTAASGSTVLETSTTTDELGLPFAQTVQNGAAAVISQITGVGRTRTNLLSQLTTSRTVPGGNNVTRATSTTYDSRGRPFTITRDETATILGLGILQTDARLTGTGAVTRIFKTDGVINQTTNITRNSVQGDTSKEYDGGTAGIGTESEDDFFVYQCDFLGRIAVARFVSAPDFIFEKNTYDARDRRTRKVVTNVPAFNTDLVFIYQGERVIEIRPGGSTRTLAQFLFGGIGDVFAMDRDTNADGDPDQSFFYTSDYQNGPSALVDDNGIPVEWYDYDGFSVPTIRDAMTMLDAAFSARGNPLLKKGAFYDAGTQHYRSASGSVSPRTGDRQGRLSGGAGSGFDANAVAAATTPQVQDKIADLLEDLRRVLDLQVTVETRFVTVSDNFLRDIGVDFRGLAGAVAECPPVNQPSDTFGSGVDDGSDDGLKTRAEGLGDAAIGGSQTTRDGLAFQPTFLDDTELEVILRAVQRSERLSMVQAPRITVFNTQRANVGAINQTSYIRDFDVEIAQTSFVADPIVGIIQDGITLDVRPTVSSDRRYVRLTLQPTVAELVRPIQTFSTAFVDDSAPIVIQLPELRLQRVRTQVTLPQTGTILLGGIKTTKKPANERGVPMLSRIPYISRLFKNVGIGRGTQSLTLMVTPRIIIQEEE